MVVCLCKTRVRLNTETLVPSSTNMMPQGQGPGVPGLLLVTYYLDIYLSRHLKCTENPFIITMNIDLGSAVFIVKSINVFRQQIQP